MNPPRKVRFGDVQEVHCEPDIADLRYHPCPGFRRPVDALYIQMGFPCWMWSGTVQQHQDLARTRKEEREKEGIRWERMNYQERLGAFLQKELKKIRSKKRKDLELKEEEDPPPSKRRKLAAENLDEADRREGDQRDLRKRKREALEEHLPLQSKRRKTSNEVDEAETSYEFDDSVSVPVEADDIDDDFVPVEADDINDNFVPVEADDIDDNFVPVEEAEEETVGTILLGSLMVDGRRRSARLGNFDVLGSYTDSGGRRRSGRLRRSN